MANNYIGLFDVIGPVMVGPSSSHTSGAATIAWMARQIFSGTPVKAEFRLYGSFAETYKGHGTDRALIGGMLGYRSDDVRIRNAYMYARKNWLRVEFVADKETPVSHPNTVDIVITGEDGHTLLVRGESIGGGRVRIRRINEIEVDFNGEYSTMIIGHQDVTGTVAYITKCLAEESVNVATLKLFREEKGKKAFTVIETDGSISEELKEKILQYETITSVDLIEI
ncbi:MAG: L-serine ammonia-lyase, iron-sulfur-dependent subunit beta [Mogibacterium sp.]|nr:L-serine ammonia-lyase, iron-sulfur-dependent subunit beta [Mogibacterium sp.]